MHIKHTAGFRADYLESFIHINRMKEHASVFDSQSGIPISMFPIRYSSYSESTPEVTPEPIRPVPATLTY